MKDGRLLLGCAPNSKTVDATCSRTREPGRERVGTDAMVLSNWRSESIKWHVRIEVILGTCRFVRRLNVFHRQWRSRLTDRRMPPSCCSHSGQRLVSAVKYYNLVLNILLWIISSKGAYRWCGMENHSEGVKCSETSGDVWMNINSHKIYMAVLRLTRNICFLIICTACQLEVQGFITHLTIVYQKSTDCFS